MAGQGSLQQPTDGTESGMDLEGEIMVLHFRLADLHRMLDKQSIGLGDMKSLYETMLGHMVRLSPQNKIISLRKMIALLERRIFKPRCES